MAAAASVLLDRFRKSRIDLVDIIDRIHTNMTVKNVAGVDGDRPYWTASEDGVILT